MVTATSCASANSRQASIAAGVVPQSSCSLKPAAPAAIVSCRSSGVEVLPLPERPMFIGKASVACSIILTCSGAGVQVVAHVPLAGPLPPP